MPYLVSEVLKRSLKFIRQVKKQRQQKIIVYTAEDVQQPAACSAIPRHTICLRVFYRIEPVLIQFGSCQVGTLEGVSDFGWQGAMNFWDFCRIGDERLLARMRTQCRRDTCDLEK